MTNHRRAAALAAAAVLVLAAGCSSDGDSTSSDATDAPASSTDDPGVVVALDDFAALNILSLGVEPDLVFEAFEYDTTAAVFDDLGIETKPYGTALDLEQVIAAEPDVIIGVSLPTTLEQEGALSEIAETTVLDYADGWEDQLADTAAALGREEVAEDIKTTLADDLEQLASDLEGTDYEAAVASLIGENEGAFSAPPESAVGSVLTGAGLERPEAQKVANTPPFVSFSEETLLDHDGDVLFMLSGGAYLTEPFTSSPLWEQMEVVQNDEVYEVSGETWLGSSAFSVDWVIRDLRAILLDDAEAATNDQAADRFQEFVG